MTKPAALFVALGAAAIAFVVAYAYPVFASEPLPWYHPADHVWIVETRPTGVAIDLYARLAQACLAWAAVFALGLAIAAPAPRDRAARGRSGRGVGADGDRLRDAVLRVDAALPGAGAGAGAGGERGPVVRCAVDVDYRTIGATGVATACVTFAAWDDAAPAHERVVVSAEPAAAYESGAFYKRELPYLLAILDGLAPELVIVDGHVWLAGDQPGLGAHLHAALGGRAAIVGVAKRPFAGATAVPVVRGAGHNPLYVSAVGIDVLEAVAGLRAMHGPFRIPTLLKRVDRLCRDAR